MLHNDKVVPPLTKNREYADPKDDTKWAIIPATFSPSHERWSGSGKKCIHVDCYFNTCVADMFKVSQVKIGAITNYLLESFQRMLKDHYIFAKKNIKIVKGKQYKAWRGTNKEIPDFCLPEAYHKDHFEKWMKKIKDKVDE